MTTKRIASPHRDLRVTYAEMPRKTRDQVAAVLEPMLWIVPPWCRSLHVRIEPQAADNVASICIDDEYRQAILELSPEWLACEDDEQRRYLCHELCHILLEPMGNFGRRLLDGLADALDKPAFELLNSEWIRVVEMVTSDLDRTLSMVDDDAVRADR